jgi:N6-adenosine-specific RNA methylase IME4
MKKYHIIYADPPWRYVVWSNKGKGRSAESHYPTMSLDEICALPVEELTTPDSALFIWVTFSHLPDVFRVIKAWGFQYKTVAFVWVKKNKKSDGWFWGLGHWTRANAEICILATKGNPCRISKSVHQIIDTPIQEHSKKPDQAREKIVELLGDLPRIELFAREQPPGWDVWGNEVESSLDFTAKGGDICETETTAFRSD